MSLTLAPYGLIPVEKQGGNPNQGGAQRAYPITVDPGYAMAVGQLATLIAGVIGVPTAAPTAGQVIGVISGFEFTDPVMKYAVQDSMLPSGAVASGYTGIKVFVNDDPNQLYKVQANAPVDQTKIGTKVNLGAARTVTTAVKRSAAYVDVAAGTPTALLVVGFFDTPASKPNDLFTDIIVKIAAPLHVYNT